MLADRFTGALFGAAVGDMIGAPFEGLTALEIRERFGEVEGPLVPVVTDDTEMTMAVARSICRRRRVDPEDIARGFVEWYGRSPASVGRTTALALSLLASGEPWHSAGARACSLLGPAGHGNGGIMRTVPVALHAFNDPELLVQTCEDVSRITHGSAICIASSVALGTAIAGLVIEKVEDALPAAALRASTLERSVAKAFARGVEGRFPPDRGPMAVHTLQTAVACVSSNATFEAAVLAAVNRGGDTDTAGSVTGALAGAAWGRTSIPPAWASMLERSQIDAREIANLAGCLHDLAVGRPVR